MFQEGEITCVVVCNILTNIDRWLKTLLKTLVNRGGELNSIGCRGMSVGNKANIFCSFLGAVLVLRFQMVLLMKNSSGSEGSSRELILAF